MMRIGELSRRTGVSPELLRAWEQRYGLLRPERSPGGFRLYSEADEGRVRRTTTLIARGLSAAEAARAAVAAPAAPAVPASPRDADEPDRPLVESLAGELQRALDAFDSGAANAVLDRLLGAVSVDYAITRVLIPYLHDLGERWAAGTATVAQEHYATHLVRGRLLGLAGDWGAGNGATVVLAGLPGEAHDLGLVMLGLLLSRRGWDVTFLGADTPLDTLEATVSTLRPSLVVLGTYDATLFRSHRDAIARLATRTPLAVAGPLDEDEVAEAGVERLADDIAEAAEQLRPRR